MPPMANPEVVPDSTDPGTLRPDLPPAIKTGSRFIPMNLPDFPPGVQLPPEVSANDAFKIWQLFFSKEMVDIIVQHTNDHNNRPYHVLKPYSRAKLWKPVTADEFYGYLGIRIYMGLHRENQIEDYWKQRSGSSWPDHWSVQQFMSRQRFEAIHGGMRVASDDPDTNFEAVFDRVIKPPLNQFTD